MKRILITLFVFLPMLVSAHQPRVVDVGTTTVDNPEISKAYYSKLTGEPAVYTISSDEPFDLYVSVLVPDIVNQKTDVSAVIIKNGDTKNPVTILDGMNFNWEKFHEPFGNDEYLMGPEYKEKAEAGNYEIRVWSSNNDSKYALAIGERENFGFVETKNTLYLVPQIKKNFFEKSPIDFVLSPIGIGYLIVMILGTFLLSFIVRLLWRNWVKNPIFGEINGRKRIYLILISLALLLTAIATTWTPLQIFFAGVILFLAF